MKNKVLYLTILALAPILCFGQSLIPVGGRPTDTLYCKGFMRLDSAMRILGLATSDTNRVIGVNAQGQFVWRVKNVVNTDTPTLQAVTTKGRRTTQSVNFNSGAGKDSTVINGNGFSIYNSGLKTAALGHASGTFGFLQLFNSTGRIYTLRTDGVTAGSNVDAYLQNASGTIAYTSDTAAFTGLRTSKQNRADTNTNTNPITFNYWNANRISSITATSPLSGGGSSGALTLSLGTVPVSSGGSGATSFTRERVIIGKATAMASATNFSYDTVRNRLIIGSRFYTSAGASDTVLVAPLSINTDTASGGYYGSGVGLPTGIGTGAAGTSTPNFFPYIIMRHRGSTGSHYRGIAIQNNTGNYTAFGQLDNGTADFSVRMSQNQAPNLVERFIVNNTGVTVSAEPATNQNFITAQASSTYSPATGTNSVYYANMGNGSPSGGTYNGIRVEYAGVTSASTTATWNGIYVNASSASNFGGSGGANLINLQRASNLRFAVDTGGKISIAVAGALANRSVGTATLSVGTVTINTNLVTANSLIYLTLQGCSSCGILYVSARTAGTSFTVTSTNGADGSTFAWWIIN